MAQLETVWVLLHGGLRQLRLPFSLFAIAIAILIDAVGLAIAIVFWIDAVWIAIAVVIWIAAVSVAIAFSMSAI